ncbi:transcriptional activator NhaR [Bythopirellula polymerisocia]|uniref:Transcriptional activator protein NhaR n=1 Tax=Bythopirellula polymerisocia TaxID=2528003 RepID=A0A5C6CK62_9BACT|nr:transcriptional activator NhaR [Bythopirellula polymerisocia]TWU24782.1 Transcriptional activator protein NhaR [Bythopirellula polymerisocia]
MEWLNYHHLYYFWLVARDGSIAKAAEQLKLAHPTISKQLRQLEASFEEKLFDQVGRNLVLTEFGQTVFRYAEEIFTIGRELQDAVHGRPIGRPLKFEVGIPDVIPKLIAYLLLMPAFRVDEDIHVVCHEGKHEELLAELALHRLDMVLSDAPIGPTDNVRAFSHLLGECGSSFFGTSALTSKYRRKFPTSLEGAPLLLPTVKTAVRRALEQWFYSEEIRPSIVGEFDDSALMKVFGQDGVGLFPAPTVIEKEVCRQYNVQVVGRTEAVRERYYAISVERRLKHPAVLAICESARQKLFEYRKGVSSS